MHTLGFRTASKLELILLRHWDGQPHVISSMGEDEWDWDEQSLEEVPWRWQFIAEINKTPIGIIQIIDLFLEETHYWGQCGPNQRAIDIWIGEEEYLNKGYGTEMMKYAINFCFKNTNVNSIIIDPFTENTRAISFYKRLGFIAEEQRYFINDKC